MTFFDALYSLFLHITFNIPTFDIDTSDIAFITVITLWVAGFVCSCVTEFCTPEPKPLPPVTWEKVARARMNSKSDLWFAVTCCIDNNHGELEGDIWRQFSKIKIEKSSIGDFRAISHNRFISLPDWQWSE